MCWLIVVKYLVKIHLYIGYIKKSTFKKDYRFISSFHPSSIIISKNVNIIWREREVKSWLFKFIVLIMSDNISAFVILPLYLFIIIINSWNMFKYISVNVCKSEYSSDIFSHNGLLEEITWINGVQFIIRWVKKLFHNILFLFYNFRMYQTCFILLYIYICNIYKLLIK